MVVTNNPSYNLPFQDSMITDHTEDLACTQKDLSLSEISGKNDFAYLHKNLMKLSEKNEVNAFSVEKIESLDESYTSDPYNNQVKILGRFSQTFRSDYPDSNGRIGARYTVKIIRTHDQIILFPLICLIHYDFANSYSILCSNPINVANALFYHEEQWYAAAFMNPNTGRWMLNSLVGHIPSRRNSPEFIRDTERIWVVIYRALSETYNLAREGNLSVSRIEFVIPSKDLSHYPFYIKLGIAPQS